MRHAMHPCDFSVWNALVHLPSIIHLVKPVHVPISLEASQIPSFAQAPSPGHTCCQGYTSVIACVSSQ